MRIKTAWPYRALQRIITELMHEAFFESLCNTCSFSAIRKCELAIVRLSERGEVRLLRNVCQLTHCEAPADKHICKKKSDGNHT
jgi:hypothetical protein